MLINNIHLAEINSPKQTIKARVELYNGSTLEKICNCADLLGDFTVEKIGEGKYFGFGICQKLKVNIIDIERELNITDAHTIEASFGVNGEFVYPFPNFYVDEVSRNETDNLLSITAFDALYKAANHTVSELVLPSSYTIKDFADVCARLLGVPLKIDTRAMDSFSLYYTGGANFDGSESIRDALNRIAEATQTIYYIDSNWDLYFKRLDKNGSALYTIEKDRYITLANDGERLLNKIVSTTELGDSVSSIEGTPAAESGVVQYIRDNPFWELREDIGSLVDQAQAVAGGTVITQFESEWGGNYLLEIGDKIALIAEDDSTIHSYILDDTITFDGTLSELTRWAFEENDAETAENPTSLGEALNKTFARVDKVSKQISMVASESNANASAIASLQINTNSIAASVKEVERVATETIEGVSDALETLTKEVSTKVDADSVQILIKKEVADGATSVKTSTTGYTFDDNGLSISKGDSEMNTTITEDGMKIYRNSTEVLTADNTGVRAEDLHATTYLIIGKYSRLEDYEAAGTRRTGCFWIGG